MIGIRKERRTPYEVVSDICLYTCPAWLQLLLRGQRKVLTDLLDELEVDGEPLLLRVGPLLPADVLVEDEPVLLPLGEEVAGDLDRVLDVVDLAHVEAVETWEKKIKI